MNLSLSHHFVDALGELTDPAPPRGFPSPELLLKNESLATALGLGELSETEWVEFFSGARAAEGSQPVALAYAGHQFGSFVPQLGDGRAVLLGEITDTEGVLKDVQLKGSGRTRFSRGGDGKATLGPILREYLVSEAMHHLGVPTTRVLVALRTGEKVPRESMLPGAVLTRVAASHLRIGTLEYLAARGETELLSRVVNYALDRHFPDRPKTDDAPRELLRLVAQKQARLIAQWMLIGFVHGVMNTDNMTLSGETIDYGPCAFMDRFDPATVFSSIDRGGRYAYGNQPPVGMWNLAMMGRALLPLLCSDEDEAVEIVRAELATYETEYQSAFQDGMRTKLGLRGKEESDEVLVSNLLSWMKDSSADFTGTFRQLAREWRQPDGPHLGPGAEEFLDHYLSRTKGEDGANIAARMDAANPIYIPRNHLVEEALAAAHQGDLKPLNDLSNVLQRPFEERAGLERYAEPAPPQSAPYRTFCGT